MYLLDTDMLTHLYAGQPKVVERLQAVDDPDIGITVITKVEVLQGRIDYLYHIWRSDFSEELVFAAANK